MIGAIARFALATAAVAAVVGVLLVHAFGGDVAARSVWSSAVVASVVQIAAFAMTRSMIAGNAMAAWGAGSLLRMLALAVYAVLAVKVLGLAPTPALLSLAVFFFLSMLLEPLFLRR